MQSKSGAIGAIGLVILIIAAVAMSGCMSAPTETKTGVQTVQQYTVPTDSNGHTADQRNYQQKINNDNKVGAIKYLYAMSPFTGDVLLSSTVDGKVTSSGKRLTPLTLTGDANDGVNGYSAMSVQIGSNEFATAEVPQDDGTYGTSAEYIYWFDTSGRYYQLYTAQMAIIISDSPLSIPKAVINLDANSYAPKTKTTEPKV